MDSGVKWTLPSSATVTVYDGISIFLSPTMMWPWITACLAWYGVLNPNLFETIVCNLRASKSVGFRLSTSSNVASFDIRPILASDFNSIGSFSSLIFCVNASNDLACCLTRDNSVCAFHNSLLVLNPNVPRVCNSSIFNS